MNWDDFLFNRFLIAIPELNFDGDFIEAARKAGIISDEKAAAYKEMASLGRSISGLRKLRNKTLLQRLLVIAPDILSVTTVNFLRRLDLIDVQTAHVLRIAMRGAQALLPNQVSEETLFYRLRKIAGSAMYNDLVDLFRNMDQKRIDAYATYLRGSKGRLDSNEAKLIRDMERRSVQMAERARGALIAARSLTQIRLEAQAASSVWGAVTVVGQGLLSEEVLLAAVRLGLIPAARFNLIRALEKYGVDAWRKGVTAFSHSGWQARALLISEGVLSYEMVDALRTADLIDNSLAALMMPAITQIRKITRGKLQTYQASTKFRVNPGESPIATFARFSADSDRAILILLQEAANDARLAALEAASTKKFGGSVRSAQQRLVENALHQQMRALWENVGHLTIFGEKQAARAALSSIDFLHDKLYPNLDREATGIALKTGARSGVDSYISREENLRQLSERVYKNTALAEGRVGREVQKALLRGTSAKEMASRVERMIKPGVPGGTSYAALRLGRTEINNAFHFTQIRYTREMPWVRGYRWNLSGSHGAPDACNTMASEDHDRLGPGVYSKANVPGKPHPQCLCYLTTVTDTSAEFEQGLRSGKYDRYLSKAANGPFGDQGTAEFNKAGASGVSSGLYSFARSAAADLSRQLGVVAASESLAFAKRTASSATRSATE